MRTDAVALVSGHHRSMGLLCQGAGGQSGSIIVEKLYLKGPLVSDLLLSESDPVTHLRSVCR